MLSSPKVILSQMKYGNSKTKIWIGASLIIAICAVAAYRLLRPSAPSRAARVAQLDKDIKTELPAKANRAQVKTWFQHHKVNFNYMDGKKYKLDDESFVVESGIAPKNLSGVMTGGLRVPAEQLFEDNCSINIAFFMNKEGKVVKHQVGWVCSGL